MMELTEQKKLEINKRHEANGIRFMDINTAYIDENVKIGSGTCIYPSVIIEGNSQIGENCVVGMCTRIENSVIGDGTQIQNSVIIESKVGNDTKVGPFAYMRPGSNVGNNCKVGDFVEIKNSNFGNGSKVSHLTYIGDADVGEEVNLGCGVVFVNYDGTNKYRSTVKDGAFIGCNSNLVSPVTVDEGAYVAAGSTVTTDVPSEALYVARSKGRVIEGWVKKRGLIKGRKK